MTTRLQEKPISPSYLILIDLHPTKLITVIGRAESMYLQKELILVASEFNSEFA